MSVMEDSIPSMKISGLLGPAKVDIPRTQKLDPSAPGSAPRWTAIIPATRPAKALLRVEVGTLRSLADTEDIAPTIDSFFCFPKPTTTTSSISVEFAVILIEMGELE
ncbi:hypothetical protein D3C79_815000 [compost metagenome]